MPFDSAYLDDPVLDRLLAARDRVQRGWCRGELRMGDSYCAVGAILGPERVETPFRLWDVFDAWALKEVRRAAGCWLPVMMWNDSKHTTKWDVLNAFDTAIERRIAGRKA